jgi:hydroxymethylglutaryl-CoA reductase
MKMHLGNIINQFEASAEERETIENHFENHPVTHSAVVTFIENLRK